ncbi:MAG: GNAT family N-acetyltransferase [Firmicutes bacterium]|nr:GNAT family N-acetyltransferase [Bacillota bacterium]
MALYLAIPAREHKHAWKQYEKELLAAGEISGRIKSYRTFLRQRRRFSSEETVPDGYVPDTLYFLMDDGGDKLLGRVSIRHRLNDYLLNNPGGHIGYAVAPGERRKGYGTQQLRLALEICKTMGLGPVLVTCLKENVASAKVIRNNGGVLEDERMSAEGKVFQRYWITL